MLTTMGLHTPCTTLTHTEASLAPINGGPSHPHHSTAITPHTPLHANAHSTAHSTAATATAGDNWSRGEVEEGWGGVDTAHVAHIDLTTSAYDASHARAFASASSPTAAAVRKAGDNRQHTHVVQPHTMLQPAVWPRLLSGSSLAGSALITTAERDAALLAHLAATCAGCEAQAGTHLCLDACTQAHS